MNMSMVKQAMNRGLLITKKHAPEILIGTGLVGMGTTIVMSSRATLRYQDLQQEHYEKRQDAELAREKFSEEEYSEMDYKKDITILYVQHGVQTLKLYGPAITMGIFSVGCILGGYNVLHKRNIAVMAAYKAVEKAYSDYRERVIDRYGVDTDWELKHGVVKEKQEYTEEVDGKMKKKKRDVANIDPNKISNYSKFFDETCKGWDKNPEYAMMFLKGIQSQANDMLIAKGHLLLNDVYDMLGIERTQAGCVVGWVVSKTGDNFVDFGLYNGGDESIRRFINGMESVVLLDFNVDGVIYDLI